MEINLLRSVKYRVMDELRYAIQENLVYKDKVEAYHKFPYDERPMMGVILRNASGSRVKLSADDHAATLKSHFTLAKAQNKQGKFIQWVWEDALHTTSYQVKEDVSSQTSGSPTFGTNRVFNISRQMVSGPNNTLFADNFRQIVVTVNGVKVFSEYVNGKKKMVILPVAPTSDSEVLVSYYYSRVTPAGRYYIEVMPDNKFVMDPLYMVEDEEVISRTTGIEMTAQLDNSDIIINFTTLYTKKQRNSTKFTLIRDTDYTVDTTGLITFLNPLEPDTTLYATYRWAGSTMGPFDIPGDYQYNNEALPGAMIAFSNQIEVGSRMVIICHPKRENSAKVRSGHYNMSFDIEVFTRDPQQLADLTDHIVNELWVKRRLKLMDEGLTMTELDPAGESEDAYDGNTGDLYYKNTLRLDIMSEWKEFTPVLWEIRDFDMNLYQFVKTNDYIITNQNKILELNLVSAITPFEVKYPTRGYARYF